MLFHVTGYASAAVITGHCQSPAGMTYNLQSLDEYLSRPVPSRSLLLAHQCLLRSVDQGPRRHWMQPGQLPYQFLGHKVPQARSMLQLGRAQYIHRGLLLASGAVSAVHGKGFCARIASRRVRWPGHGLRRAGSRQRFQPAGVISHEISRIAEFDKSEHDCIITDARCIFRV